MMIKVLSGNTIRFECTFYDFENSPVDPTEVKVIVYDKTYTRIVDVLLGEANKIDVGKYYYNFVVPESNSTTMYIFEFYGRINDAPAIAREQIMAEFI